MNVEYMQLGSYMPTFMCVGRFLCSRNGYCLWSKGDFLTLSAILASIVVTGEQHMDLLSASDPLSASKSNSNCYVMQPSSPEMFFSPSQRY